MLYSQSLQISEIFQFRGGRFCSPQQRRVVTKERFASPFEEFI